AEIDLLLFQGTAISNNKNNYGVISNAAAGRICYILQHVSGCHIDFAFSVPYADTVCQKGSSVVDEVAVAEKVYRPPFFLVMPLLIGIKVPLQYATPHLNG